MRLILRVVLAVGLLSAITGPAFAQGAERGARLVGVVIDSLARHGVRPGEAFRRIPGARVSIDGGAMSAVTDSLGLFVVDPITPGRHRLQYWDAWLDRLGLGPLMAEVEVAADSTVGLVFATPSFRTYHARVCDGAPVDDATAVLIGEISRDGAPVTGIRLEAVWRETRITAGGAVEREERRHGTADVSGRYTLCGVPLDADVDLQVHDGAGASLRLVVSVLEPVARRDVRLRGVPVPAEVVGTVTDSTGRALLGAEVLDAAGVVVARSDSSGRFRLRVPGGESRQLWVRAIAHQPQRVDVETLGEQNELGTVVLAALAFGLDTMRVTGRPDPLDWRPDFERRRRISVGAQITPEQLARMPRVTPNQLAQFARRVRVVGARVALVYGAGTCFPRWFVDGSDRGKEIYPPGEKGPLMERGESQEILDRAKAIEVYSAAQAPPKFNDFSGCGAIVVWTR